MAQACEQHQPLLVEPDWSGEKMTKEEAKKYVTEYRSAR